MQTGNEEKMKRVLDLSQGIQGKVSSVRIVWRMSVKKQNEEKSTAAMFVDATLANNDGSSMTVRSKVGWKDVCGNDKVSCEAVITRLLPQCHPPPPPTSPPCPPPETNPYPHRNTDKRQFAGMANFLTKSPSTKSWMAIMTACHLSQVWQANSAGGTLPW